MFPSPVRPEPAGVEPAASSAGADPSASAPVDPGPEYMDVDLKIIAFTIIIKAFGMNLHLLIQ